MKIMANCDKTCELQLSVNHRIIERTAPLSKALPRIAVCAE